MRSIAVYHKPGYVHGLRLKDALNRACDPDASDRDIVIRRSRVNILDAEPPSGEGSDTMLVEVSGPHDDVLQEHLCEVIWRVIAAAEPGDCDSPWLHVRFIERSTATEDDLMVS